MRFRRLLCLLLCAALMPVCAFPEESSAAAPVSVVIDEGKKSPDPAWLTDGDDETGFTAKKDRTVTVTLALNEGETLSHLRVRLDAAPLSASMQTKNEKGKFADLVKLRDPGTEFMLSCDEPLEAPLRLCLTFEQKTAVRIQELAGYDAGTPDFSCRPFTKEGRADALMIAETEEALSLETVAALQKEGRTVQCVIMGTAGENVHALQDRLYEAGCLRTPLYLGLSRNAAALAGELCRAIRRYRPGVILADEELWQTVDLAALSAQDSTFQPESASVYGLWVAPSPVAPRDALSADFSFDGPAALREMCALQNADALHADPAAIPYPERLADGYLPEGSEDFAYEDPEAGLWAYVSDTLQIEILRYDQPDLPRRWFVSDIRFKPDRETFHQQTYTKAAFDGQMTYPETLAQNAKLVFGINGDYYIYREKNGTTGTVIRNGSILHAYKKPDNYPNLDCVALYGDGSISVHAAGEVTAYDFLKRGAHDVLSFGPYLVKDGALRVYSGMNYDHFEPRCALGMVEPGHLITINAEGRFSAGYGPRGVTLNWLAAEMYARGVTEAINLDGGNTAVLIFLGEKLNRTATKGGKAETKSRNMSELFGIGTSDRVHTDKLNGVD